MRVNLDVLIRHLESMQNLSDDEKARLWEIYDRKLEEYAQLERESGTPVYVDSL